MNDLKNWKSAIKSMKAKGYRRTKNGRYETFISNNSKSINLGTYQSENEAKDAVLDYRLNRFKKGVENHNLDPNDGVVYEDNYIAFDNGMIFNLHGEKMIGCVNRDGYKHGIFNGKNKDHHKIIADCFIPNPKNLKDVNHMNGNKLDNNVTNLQRCTHAYNVEHSYKNGLQKRVGNKYGTFKVLNKHDLNVIKKLHLEGYTDRKISEKLGCSRELVSRRIREMKLR